MSLSPQKKRQDRQRRHGRVRKKVTGTAERPRLAVFRSARHISAQVIDDRAGNRSTILTSQLPIEHWHAWLNDPTVADAILDRLVHRAHRIALKGESLRRKTQEKSKTATPS